MGSLIAFLVASKSSLQRELLWIFELFLILKNRKLFLLLLQEIKERLAITFDIPMVVATTQGSLDIKEASIR